MLLCFAAVAHSTQLALATAAACRCVEIVIMMMAAWHGHRCRLCCCAGLDSQHMQHWIQEAQQHLEVYKLRTSHTPTPNGGAALTDLRMATLTGAPAACLVHSQKPLTAVKHTIRNHSRRACSHSGVPGLQLAEEQRHANGSTKHCSAATSHSRSPESRANLDLGDVLGTLQRKHSSSVGKRSAKAAAALFITILLPDSMQKLRLGFVQ